MPRRNRKASGKIIIYFLFAQTVAIDVLHFLCPLLTGAGDRAVAVSLLHHSREANFYLPNLGILPWVNTFEPPA